MIKYCNPAMLQLDFFKRKENKHLNTLSLIESLTYKFLPSGEALFYFGDTGTEYYFLLKGLCSAWVPVPPSLSVNDMYTFLLNPGSPFIHFEAKDIQFTRDFFDKQL
jgi:hypothetical protein